ncbi:hypothetical protein TWF506_002052 [Arthrobotrys conoides]|uniref:Uncharacterized protein n=1 Tax=Arthrobotrys conoides TaxID=74498 RepID=A0AAN8RYK4_9PEZI
MAQSSRSRKKANLARKLTKKPVARNLHESEAHAITSGAAAAISLESNDLYLPEPLETNHDKLVVDEQGPPTKSFETLEGLKSAEGLGYISSTALQPVQSKVFEYIEPQGQLFETCREDEQSNTPHSSPNPRKQARKRKNGRSNKGVPAKSVKEELYPVDTTSLTCDRVLSSAVHRDASAEAALLSDDREFTKSVSRAITKFQQNFPTIDLPLPRISQRRGYEVVVSPATKSFVKKKLNSASKNLLNYEKGGALSSDYHVYTVKNTGSHDLPVFFTALGSLEDNVLVIDNPSCETDKMSAGALASEIAFDAWLWIPPSVKPDSATTDDIKQLRLILEQDDVLQLETPMLDFLAGKLFDAGEFKPCQPIRLSLMSESQMREDCFYLLSGAPGLKRIKEMLRNHSKMLGGSWPSEIHILKVNGRWARLTILQKA